MHADHACATFASHVSFRCEYVIQMTSDQVYNMRSTAASPCRESQYPKRKTSVAMCMHAQDDDAETRARTERVPIVLAGADCDGTEGALTDCLGKPLGRFGRQCNHDSDVYLVCFSPDPGSHRSSCFTSQAFSCVSVTCTTGPGPLLP